MASKRAREEAIPPTKPGHRLGEATAARKNASEAPTLPPPPPKNSHMRPKKRASSRSIRAPSATVDEVVADLTNDPRREDED
jgi:hypothetical protein